MIAALRSSLRAAVLALPEYSGATARVIGWENRPVTPPPATPGAAPWALELLRVGPERIVGAGVPRTLEARPLYQLTVHVPAGEGTGRLDALAEALLRAFRPGHRLVAVDDQQRVTLDVRCDSAEPGPVVLAPEAPGWAARAVRIGCTTRRRVDASGAPVPLV